MACIRRVRTFFSSPPRVREDGRQRSAFRLLLFTSCGVPGLLERMNSPLGATGRPSSVYE